jgi:DNA replication regulator SLD3
MIAEDVFSNATLPSNVPRIPQSVPRPPPEEQTRNPLFSIQATPTRKPMSNFAQQGNGFLAVVAADHGNCQLLSPLQLGHSSGHLFNLAPTSVINGPPSSWSSQGIQETPLKKKSEAMQAHSHPGLSTPGCGKENVGSRGDISAGLKQDHKETNEDSIYKSLGWEDTDDIDDLA